MYQGVMVWSEREGVAVRWHRVKGKAPLRDDSE